MEEKIGIYGGSFNPVHAGHLNSLRTVLKKNKLNKIFLVPNSKNPLKDAEDVPSAEHRVNMLKLAIKDDAQFFVDEQEVVRGGVSYSIETVRFYESKYGSENVYFIMGADTFENIDQWKNFEDILKAVNLIVTTRPKSDLPYSVEDFPKGVQALVKSLDPAGKVKLKTGRDIYYTQLEDIDISATEVRKKLKLSRPVESFLTYEVEKYIKENSIYAPLKIKIPDFLKFTHFCSQVLVSKKAITVKALDLNNTTAPSEYVVIASGTSTKQAVSLGESVLKAVKEEFGVYPISIEGMEEGRWVLIDYGALIVHVFYDYVRSEYQLEKLWAGGKDLNIKN